MSRRGLVAGDFVKHKRIGFLQFGLIKEILFTAEKIPLYNVLWVARKEFERTTYHLAEELELAY